MYQRTWRVTVLTSLIIALGGFFAADVQGGQVLDWLFGGGSSTNKQVVAYYPPTAYAPQPGMAYQAYYGGQPTVAYQVPAANVYAPAAACPPPAAACCPQPVVCPPQPTNSWSWLGSCFGGRSSPSPAVVPSINPIPQTYYRTTWKRVPVTSFRPVTSADPITGCPVTVMKPCTTYTWQADRRECNFFDRLLGRCSRAPAATQPCCVPTECMATASDCCGGPASYGVPVMASPSPTPAPYYAPGNSTTVPGLAPPPSAPTLSPQTMPPSFGSPSGGSPSGGAAPAPGPADTRPRLKPAEDDFSSSDLTPLPSASPGPPAPAPTAEEEAAGMAPLPPFGAPAARPGSLQLNPVPDPDATPAPIDVNSAPQLLNPRDQTALLRADQRWAYTTISWPEPSARRPTVNRAPIPTAAIPAATGSQQRNPARWDESGWRSAR